MDVFANIPELLKFAATLGVGGALAFGMFLFYRIDTLNSAKRWEGQAEALISIVKENTQAITSLQVSTTSLQASVTALTQLVDLVRHEMTDRDLARLREGGGGRRD